MVFSPFLSHEEVAGNHKVRSAGYCEMKDSVTWMVSGRSDSLNCYSEPRDVELLNRHLSSGH
jgi:hypothetical protein